MVTIEIDPRRQTLTIEQTPPRRRDVTAHHIGVDPASGASDWHIDWELGVCDFVDASGSRQEAYLWHRHPFGTEYTEVYDC